MGRIWSGKNTVLQGSILGISWYIWNRRYRNTLYRRFSQTFLVKIDTTLDVSLVTHRHSGQVLEWPMASSINDNIMDTYNIQVKYAHYLKFMKVNILELEIELMQEIHEHLKEWILMHWGQHISEQITTSYLGSFNSNNACTSLNVYIVLLYFLTCSVCGLIVPQEDMPFTDLVGYCLLFHFCIQLPKK